ncbi:MAG: VWA domain-containing protein [Desulfofustis sp.]|jgi:Ca-activated chloride channel family protein
MDKKGALFVLLLFLVPASCGENSVHTADEGLPVDSDRETATHRVKEDPQKEKELTAGDVPASLPGVTQLRKNQIPALAAESAMAVDQRLFQPPYPRPGLTQPGRWNRESYDAIEENRFINTRNDPLSTFSIDVDTASYANVRRLITAGSLPPRGAVRTEEMLNYFSYTMAEPDKNQPFSLQVEAGPSPFHQGYKLVKIGLKAKDIKPDKLPPSNLVFLIDVSGSMNQPTKLPLLKQSLKLLAAELSAQDRVAMVVYAGSDRIVLPPTQGSETDTIKTAIDNLLSGGSTHASSGIITAYELAVRSFMPGGNNRVILVSDGDFNVGITSRAELQNLIEEKRQSGVYLTVLGFGNGNYHDDTMEILADKGNGNYAYIDSLLEAKKVLIKERSGTLFTLANDVKIQVEFNPALVGAYRLIGYENRALQDEDFRDDSKDAGEIGMGHRVTALYEIMPAGNADIPAVDPLKYRQPLPRPDRSSDELLTVKLRYKANGASTSTQIERAAPDNRRALEQTSVDFRFAASVAGFAMLLRESDHLGSFDWDECVALARQARGEDQQGYRAEFARLVEMAQLLKEQG